MRRYLKDRNIEFDVSRTQLDLNASDRLGSGQFGSVCRATYRIDGEPPVTVAVKTLKNTVYRNTSKQAREDPGLVNGEARGGVWGRLNGEGCVPSPELFLNFYPEMAHFCAFC